MEMESGTPLLKTEGTTSWFLTTIEYYHDLIGNHGCDIIDAIHKAIANRGHMLKIQKMFHEYEIRKAEKALNDDFEKFEEFWNQAHQVSLNPEFNLICDPIGDTFQIAYNAARKELESKAEFAISNLKFQYILKKAEVEKQFDDIITALEEYNTPQFAKQKIPTEDIVYFQNTIVNDCPKKTTAQKNDGKDTKKHVYPKKSKEFYNPKYRSKNPKNKIRVAYRRKPYYKKRADKPQN
jgi:hypothetical protein